MGLELDNKNALKDELHKLRPSELLVSKKLYNDHKIFFEELSFGFNFIINTLEDWHFDYQSCYEYLLSHFKVHSLDGFGLKEKMATIISSGALIKYLKEDLSITLNHIQKISSPSLLSFMALDHNSIRNLELTESFSRGNKNTLLEVLDFTKTPMGGRLLVNWIKYPLLNVAEINKRLDAIEEFLQKPFAMDEISFCLGKIRDLERIIMKISSGYATPKDLASLRFSLENIPKIKELLEGFSSGLLKEEIKFLEDLPQISSLIAKAIVDNPPLRISDGDTFKEGYNKDLDDLRSISKTSKSFIASYQTELREETKIKTLKVGFTGAFGYYIEVSKGQADKIPPGFHRRQTLVNAERFVTEKLKDFEHKVLTAEDRILSLENLLYTEIKQIISGFSDKINLCASAIGKIDTLLSLATGAKKYYYVRPIVDNSDVLEIKEGRHPIIENSLPLNSFIPNDTFLNEKERLFLITGPNMAGKSTYIRQVGIIVIMAQMGSFVPAASAHIGLIDRVFSRIGASDDLARGQSTFMVEMTETANILNNATSKSLVILDEIGRGTSTYDGISIAWAVSEYLLTAQNKRAKTLFATHYWELTKLEGLIDGAVNYNIVVKETSSGIVFLRKIEKGSTDKSYGIHVAKLAGLPSFVIKNAEKMLQKLEKNSYVRPLKKEEEYPLFTYQKPLLIEELKQVDIDRLSPLEALQKLLEFKQKALKS
jgi:DNA mismatch repair protein MutS